MYLAHILSHATNRFPSRPASEVLASIPRVLCQCSVRNICCSHHILTRRGEVLLQCAARTSNLKVLFNMCNHVSENGFP